MNAKSVTLEIDKAGRVVGLGTTVRATTIMLALGTGDDDATILREHNGLTQDGLDVLRVLNGDVSEWL